MPKTDQRVISALTQLPHSPVFEAIEAKILAHNQTLEKEEKYFHKTVGTLEASLVALKSKESSYLDGLMRQAFLSEERKRINDKRSELDHDIKRVQADLLKTRFDLLSKTDEKLDGFKFKESLLSFGTQHPSYSKEEFKSTMNRVLSEVIYYKDRLIIRCQGLQWPIDWPNPDP